MINYSIIIPHKNIPHLLRRCLDSIPPREDIEILVVDDCSDGTYLDTLRSISEDYSTTCRFIFTEEGKGAGYARNVGISESCGKWLLFADADDYFTPGFVEALDVHRDSEVYVVYFSTKRTKLGKIHVDYPANNREYLSFTHWVPWGKLFNRQYIVSNDFRFEEIMIGNDMMFVIKACYYAPIFLIDEFVLYVYETRVGSLCFLQSKELNRLRFELQLRMSRFAELVEAKEYRQNLLTLFLVGRRRDPSVLWSYLRLIVKHKQFGWFLSCLIENIEDRLSLTLWGEEPLRRFICKHDKRLIYLNNAKVACSSIKASMFKDFDDYEEVHRFTNERYLRFYVDLYMKPYYKFTFVRNPYQRLISCYENKVVQEKSFFKNYLSGRLYEISDFDDFIRRIVQIPHEDAEPHFQSQSYLIYNRLGRRLVDFVGKFENMKAEYEPIRQRFGLNPLPHKNKVASLLGRNWMDYYTSETAELVYVKYKKDFTRFGYKDEYKKLKTYLKDKSSK